MGHYENNNILEREGRKYLIEREMVREESSGREKKKTSERRKKVRKIIAPVNFRKLKEK